MVKKSIIAIAMLSMLATVSYAAEIGGPVWDPNGYKSGAIKVDGDWPATITITYTAVPVCKIPIYIKVGMFIEITNCSDRKIVLKQQTCPSGQSFPCYKGCTDIKVRANFLATLRLQLSKIDGSIIKVNPYYPFNDLWKAYFKVGDNTATSWDYTGVGTEQTVTVCVEAWDVNIYAATPGCDNVALGHVYVTAVPTATPNICDYVDACGDNECDPNDDTSGLF